MRMNVNVKEFLRDSSDNDSICTQSYVKSLAWIESFWVFNLGFNSLMKSISKITQSNLDLHFFKTENCLSTKSVKLNTQRDSIRAKLFTWLCVRILYHYHYIFSLFICVSLIGILLHYFIFILILLVFDLILMLIECRNIVVFLNF